MYNFSKFLGKNEILRYLAKKRQKRASLYLLVFVFLPLAFFLLYPLTSSNRQGLALWLSLILFLLLLISQLILQSEDCYLLTNQRIIFLVWQHKEYKVKHEIFLEDIDQVYKHAIFNLCLIMGEKKIYLTNLKNRNIFLQKLRNLL